MYTFDERYLDLRYSNSSSNDDRIPVEELTQQLHDLVTELSPDVLKTTIVGLGFGAWIAIQLLTKNKITSNLVVISFAIPTTFSVIETLRRELAERAALAQKWGMQVIADKAVVHWMSQDDRNSETWNQVKEIILETTVAELNSLSKCYIQSIDCYWKDSKDGSIPLNVSDCRVLLVTASSDGDMPEEMASCLALTADGQAEMKVIQRAPRLFWWGSAGEGFARYLESWILRG
jgi:pimeloyl-ACP methyl ester carboxylesterase